jgi:uncharacterized membrane protein
MQFAVGRRLFAAGAVLWAGSIVLAAFAASRAEGTRAADFFALAVYSLGSVVCHQRPERSFHLWAAQMPVCARCTGIYVGAAITVLALQPRVVMRAIPRGVPIVVLAIALAPTAVTIAYEWAAGQMTSNVVRLAAGFCLGAGIATTIVLALAPSGVAGRPERPEVH